MYSGAFPAASHAKSHTPFNMQKRLLLLVMEARSLKCSVHLCASPVATTSGLLFSLICAAIFLYINSLLNSNFVNFFDLFQLISHLSMWKTRCAWLKFSRCITFKII